MRFNTPLSININKEKTIPVKLNDGYPDNNGLYNINKLLNSNEIYTLTITKMEFKRIFCIWFLTFLILLASY